MIDTAKNRFIEETEPHPFNHTLSVWENRVTILGRFLLSNSTLFGIKTQENCYWNDSVIVTI